MSTIACRSGICRDATNCTSRYVCNGLDSPSVPSPVPAGGVALFDVPQRVSEAVISDCTQYRYWLSRTWDPELPVMIFAMLNPSTADKDRDDNTSTRCEGFARREGCGGYVIVNPNAFRATEPGDMLAASDPVGPDNERWLRAALELGLTNTFVVAWGVNMQPARAAWFLSLAREVGTPLWCLGLAKGGQPRHPLMLRGDSPLIPFGDAS